MKLFFSLIVLAIVLLYPLLSYPFYYSHDGEAHVARFAAYYQAFQDGHFPARWAGNLNFGYGTPIFIFYYPLPGYIASVFHLFGLHFQDIFKMLIVSSFVLAPFTFYLWARVVFKKPTAIFGGLLYGLAPYHFLNLYVRGDVAELLAFVFVPLVFWAIEKTLATKKLLFILLGGLFYSLLILAHNGVSLMFSPIFLLYAFVRSKNKKMFLQCAAIFVFGLVVSAFFWLPALYEGKYVNAKLFIGDMYKDHFPTFLQLINPQWGFGPDVQKSGGLSPQIGLLYLMFVIASCFLWVKEKKHKKLLGTWIGIFLAAVFIVLPVSDIVWKNLAILRLYEFPWRFVGLVSFASSVLACFILDKIKDKKLFLVFFILLIVTSLPFVKVKEYISKDDEFYQSFSGTTYFHGEASPIWTAGDPSKIAPQQIEIIGGKGKINSIEKKTHIHTYSVDAKGDITVLDNTVYFPGWQVMIDGKKVPIQFQDSNHRGLITFSVPQGKHNVIVKFAESPIRKLADIASLLGLFLMLILFMRVLHYNKK